MHGFFAGTLFAPTPTDPFIGRGLLHYEILKKIGVREARAASALNHPHIVTIHDIARDDKIDFIVMEYVDGQPLNRLIPRLGMALRDAVEYGLQIADAVAAAHRAGIVRRDLKPANVIATPTGRVRVLDFGLAMVDSLTARGGLAAASYPTVGAFFDAVIGRQSGPQPGLGRATTVSESR